MGITFKMADGSTVRFKKFNPHHCPNKEVNSAMRREFVRDNHEWFMENAPKYNFVYEFIPAENPVAKTYREITRNK